MEPSEATAKASHPSRFGQREVGIIKRRAVCARTTSTYLVRRTREARLVSLVARRRSNNLWRGVVGPILAMTSANPALPMLVVAEQDQVRSAFVAVLTAAGFEVIEAEDKFVALETLRQNAISAVVLDIDMPVPDALFVLDELDAPPPIVVVTADGFDLELGFEIYRRGDKIFDYVKRPIPPHLLVRLVGEAVLTGQ